MLTIVCTVNTPDSSFWEMWCLNKSDLIWFDIRRCDACSIVGDGTLLLLLTFPFHNLFSIHFGQTLHLPSLLPLCPPSLHSNTSSGLSRFPPWQLYLVERGGSAVNAGLAIKWARVRIPLCYRFEDWAFSFSPLTPQLTQLYEYLAIDSGGNVSHLDFARNCSIARMLPGEAELVSEWTGLPGGGQKV